MACMAATQQGSLRLKEGRFCFHGFDRWGKKHNLLETMVLLLFSYE